MDEGDVFAIADEFYAIRGAIMRLEDLVGSRFDVMPECDVKELDKGICVAKVGMKLIKRTLVRNGIPHPGREAKNRVHRARGTPELP